MKAMILAAGRGERMRPLTDHMPKPLLRVGGEPLIGWHLRQLRAAGIQQIVINHAWLGAQLEAWLGNGRAYDVTIAWSRECVPLETAGGIAQALPLLGYEEPFLLINGDVFANIDFNYLISVATTLNATHRLAHLALVANPQHHQQGDFSLHNDMVLTPGNQLTYAGVAVYHPALFVSLAAQQPVPATPLLPVLLAAMQRHHVTGYPHRGYWFDVGTLDRLAEVEQFVSSGVGYESAYSGH